MSERVRAKRLPAELIAAVSSQQGSDDETGIRTRLYLAIIRDVFENGLTKTQKCYIMLYYRDGLTMAEIAERCNVNKSTVSRTIAAARRKVDKRLKRFMEIR
ncbi:MAG: helix-turn-helix domain-containing protein [Ruminococcus sp.]|nr:helix-turn-helix domain-containing protein [Ruminococcus sp.]